MTAETKYVQQHTEMQATPAVIAPLLRVIIYHVMTYSCRFYNTKHSRYRTYCC